MGERLLRFVGLQRLTSVLVEARHFLIDGLEARAGANTEVGYLMVLTVPTLAFVAVLFLSLQMLLLHESAVVVVVIRRA